VGGEEGGGGGGGGWGGENIKLNTFECSRNVFAKPLFSEYNQISDYFHPKSKHLQKNPTFRMTIFFSRK